MKIEIMGTSVLADWQVKDNLEKELEHKAAQARGEELGEYEPTYSTYPDKVTLEDSPLRGFVRVSAGNYNELEISIEDLKRALKVF